MIVVAQAPSPQPTVAPTPVASPTPSPAPSPAPAPSADANASRARAEFDAWQSGKVDLSHYIKEAETQFTAAVVKSISDQLLKPLGAVKTFTLIRTVTTQGVGVTVYVYRVVCANGTIEEAISWNAAGKIQYIQFVPPS